MNKKLSFLTVLEAQGAYGKTYYIENTCNEFKHLPVLKFSPDTNTTAFFEKLDKNVNIVLFYNNY